jgi:hypothetical protein
MSVQGAPPEFLTVEELTHAARGSLALAYHYGTSEVSGRPNYRPWGSRVGRFVAPGQGGDAVADIMATVERLAAQQPEATLPCPRCGAGLKAANLERHLGKVHPSDADRPIRASWSGADRVIAWPLFILPLLFTAAVVAWDWRAGGDGHRMWFLVAAGVLLAGTALGGLALSDADPFRARLTLTDGGARLRHTLGLRRRNIGPVQRLETGAAYKVVPAPGTAGYHDVYAGVDQRAGSYLRLRGRRNSITVRSRNSQLRTSWTGWHPAKRRRRWDITLTDGDFAALQYSLAEPGLLRPRDGSPAAGS